MNDELEDLKQCMAEQGLTVDVKREADGKIRVDMLEFDSVPEGSRERWIDQLADAVMSATAATAFTRKDTPAND